MTAKILVIDDDRNQADLLTQFISLWGYDVSAAYGGLDGLAQIEDFKPDLIICDLLMPDLPGLEVLKMVKENPINVDLPVIILSAEVSEEIRIVSLSSGASDFIGKPVDMADLALRIQNGLELLTYKRQLKDLNKKLEKEKNRLLRYFSHDLVEKILNEEITSDLGGDIIPATIVFFDVRGSTTIAERIGPKNYASFLSEIFADIMDLVFQINGSVNELLGDGILITFGCPAPSERDAFNALVLANAVRDYMKKFNQRRPDFLDSELKYGIGIATGKIFAGNIGSVRRMKYAVMGDPVNAAARLQDLTKELGTDIVVDGETIAKAGGRIKASLTDVHHVRGKEDRMDIFKFEGIELVTPQMG